MRHQFTPKKTNIVIQQDLTDLWTIQGCSLPKRLVKTRLRDSAMGKWELLEKKAFLYDLSKIMHFTGNPRPINLFCWCYKEHFR